VRTTIGTVSQVTPTGTIFVHEAETRKYGFLDNSVPVTGCAEVKIGMELSLDVEDRGNVMVVAAARLVRSLQ
jgi:hypothetical protein